MDPFKDESDGTISPNELLVDYIKYLDRERLEYEFFDLIKQFALHINYVNKHIISTCNERGDRLSDLKDFCVAKLKKDMEATVSCKDVLWIITDPRLNELKDND